MSAVGPPGATTPHPPSGDTTPPPAQVGPRRPVGADHPGAAYPRGCAADGAASRFGWGTWRRNRRAALAPLPPAPIPCATHRVVRGASRARLGPIPQPCRPPGGPWVEVAMPCRVHSTTAPGPWLLRIPPAGQPVALDTGRRLCRWIDRCRPHLGRPAVETRLRTP